VPFQQGMTIQPGESAYMALDLTEEQLLEIDYQIKTGRKPCLTLTYTSGGKDYEQNFEIPEEFITNSLDQIAKAKDRK